MSLMSLGAQVAHVDKVPLAHDMKESETGTHMVHLTKNSIAFMSQVSASILICEFRYLHFSFQEKYLN